VLYFIFIAGLQRVGEYISEALHKNKDNVNVKVQCKNSQANSEEIKLGGFHIQADRQNKIFQ
jgi:hypothetical protein